MPHYREKSISFSGLGIILTIGLMISLIFAVFYLDSLGGGVLGYQINMKTWTITIIAAFLTAILIGIGLKQKKRYL